MMKRPLFAILAFALISSAAYACNIPVFRYALERWQPDVCELIVFHDGPLTAEQQAWIRTFQSQSADKGGDANTDVRLSNVAAEIQPALKALWAGLKHGDRLELPYVVVRSRTGSQRLTGLKSIWRGPLASAMRSAVVDSPVRKELAKRLLAGDSIVWLMVRSQDDARNNALREMVSEQCEQLSAKIELPDGIGLPGSELFSDVPLTVKFTLLEIDPADPKEQLLVRLFTAYQPDAIAEGQPLIVPVFGRGRALEVIPADELDARLMEDLTLFLCGACSCQVKEQNPGFDLLLSANWERELFGESGGRPPLNSTGDKQAPVLLTIPPGRK